MVGETFRLRVIHAVGENVQFVTIYVVAQSRVQGSDYWIVRPVAGSGTLEVHSGDLEPID